MRKQILDITPERYQKHSLHSGDSSWSETNCYVDLWIELLHAMGHDPIAALPFTFAIDFEGDQWTFFKYPIADLYHLYGLDVQELNIWKPLRECVEIQISKGRPVLAELDSYYLPDTQGTAYQIEHVKTTVGINEFDIESKYMAYFHNQGYFELSGDNFEQLFLAEDRDIHVLPPYVEFVKQRKGYHLSDEALTQHSIETFKSQLANAPIDNPFNAFKERFIEDFADLEAIDLEYFHKYSFATFRQYGACFELCKTYLLWLKNRGVSTTNLDTSASLFASIAETSKVLQFQLARSVKRNRALDLGLFEDSANHWQQAMNELKQDFLGP